jgi:hypothetical protein
VDYVIGKLELMDNFIQNRTDNALIEAVAARPYVGTNPTDLIA